MLKHPTKSQMGKTMVYFVRHGDRASHNGMPQHPGPGLSILGKKQAKIVAKQFARMKEEIDILYTSDMTRALETAYEIGKAIHKKPRVEHNLREIDPILEKRDYSQLHYWKKYFEFSAAKRIFDHILHTHRGKVIVIVAHGRLIRSLVGWKFGLSLWKSNAFDHHNCHVTLIRFKGNKLDYIHYFNSKGLA